MSTFSVRRLGLGAAVATAVVALVAACASSTSSGTPAGGGSNSSQRTSAMKSASGLNTRSTSIGTVLVDSSGRTVYELVGDSMAKPTCSGGCLSIWPAVKNHGKQVVVNGHPAYTYVGDKAPGQTNGQKVRDQWGLWLALDANGNPIHSGSAPSSSPASPPSSPTTSKAPGGGGPAF